MRARNQLSVIEADLDKCLESDGRVPSTRPCTTEKVTGGFRQLDPSSSSSADSPEERDEDITGDFFEQPRTNCVILELPSTNGEITDRVMAEVVDLLPTPNALDDMLFSRPFGRFWLGDY